MTLPGRILVVLAIGLWMLPLAGNAEELKYYDVYLTGDRICRQCTWKPVEIVHGHAEKGYAVELSNREGERSVVAQSEIVGVDKNPLARKLMIRGLHGMGLGGKIIVPAAFGDQKDFTCKYCD